VGHLALDRDHPLVAHATRLFEYFFAYIRFCKRRYLAVRWLDIVLWTKIEKSLDTEYADRNWSMLRSMVLV
jgi:hypothetical protein